MPGETRTLAEIAGPGAIHHFWVTIASSEPQHLRKLVLRMYWDGEASPSVLAPIGDFFGTGHAEYAEFASRLDDGLVVPGRPEIPPARSTARRGASARQQETRSSDPA